MATAATTNETSRRAASRANRVVRPLLAAHVRRYWPALFVGSLLAVLQVATKLAEPWPLGWLVDNALTGTTKGAASIRSDLLIAVGSLAGIVAVGAFFDYWSTRLLSSAGLHVANDMRGRAFTHLHRLSLGYHKQHQVGDLTARVTADVDNTQDMLVQMLANLFPNLLLVVGMFVVMVTVDPFLTLLSLMTTPLLGLAEPAPIVVVRARGTETDIVTVLSPGVTAVTLRDQTINGLLRCQVARGVNTDLITWAATTDVVWDRRSS